MIPGVSVKPTSASGPPTGPTARLLREPLHGDRCAREVLALLSAERLPFALTGRWAGGGAIISSDPVAVANPDDDPFAILDRLPAVAPSGTAGAGAVGAVGGGWFGWLGYRLGARVERVPEGPPRPVPMPEFHLAYYDNVLRRDADGRWWFEALASAERHAELARRLRHLRALLGAGDRPGGHRPRADPPPPLHLDGAAAAHHLAAVADCRERIAAGEIFQANLCLRLQTSFDGTGAELLERALQHTEPGYAASFDTPHGTIASLSPELFLRRRGDELVTAPIKGTAPRPEDPLAAAQALERLRSSTKDAAEHVMIVDLMRNDLGRVARYGSVRAPRWPTAEALPGLWHLVSHVRAQLRDGVGNADVLRATFPPGSVTGAPKVRALRVIAESELTGREVYTGAIGYASPVAGLELSVAIRTLELRDRHLWLGAGGGIVADSDPARELEEALLKARPIAAAIGTTVTVGRVR
ncbi:MAG: chorismate-binding protein [Solirubrobacteraceae bacterium]